MASLAQYSATLHDTAAVERPAPGAGARWVGLAIYAALAALVLVAAFQAG